MYIYISLPAHHQFNLKLIYLVQSDIHISCRRIYYNHNYL